MRQKLEKIRKEAWTSDAIPNGHMQFDVQDQQGVNYVVDLNLKRCVCGFWEIRGIPCKHPARCLLWLNYKLEDWCGPYYSLELYRATYSGVIYPIEHQRFWPTFKWPLLDPPFVVKKRGPIAKDRVRGPEDGRKRPTRSRTVRCSKCNDPHHNSLTCKGQGNKPSIKIRKRPAPLYGTGQKRRGRPRKQAPVSTVCQPSSTEPPSSQPASTQPSSSQPSSA